VMFQNTANESFFMQKKILGKRTRTHQLNGSGVNLNNYVYRDYPAGDTVNFLFVGRLLKEKGIDLYLDAADAIYENHKNVMFHICGSYDDMRYEELLKDEKRKHYVIYHGSQKQMKPFYEMASCIVHPSYYPEGMSNVLLEAAASGRPAIAADRSGCRETVDDGVTGYIEANKTRLIRVNTHKVTTSGLNAPDALQEGQGYSVGGAVSLKQDGLKNLKLSILDQDGNTLYTHKVNKDGTMVSITKGASNALPFSKLTTGVYTYTVTCDIENFYVLGEDLIPEITTVTLLEKIFTVGDAELPSQEEDIPSEDLVNGWQFDEATGLWKYYVNGALASGWIFNSNADYYILADGTAATGCLVINGENRYFTSSGVMRTGWYETAEGKMYLLSNGAPAKGWHKVEGTPFYFDENGILDADAEYVPEDHPELELPTDVLFTELFENMSKFTEMYELCFG